MLAHRDEEGRTPLALACALGHLEAVQALVKVRTQPTTNQARPHHHLCLPCAAPSPTCPPATCHLLPPAYSLFVSAPFQQRFADPSARDLNKNTPLHLACRRGHLHIVKYLLTLRGAAPSSPFAPSLSSSSSSSGPSSSPLGPDAFLRGASPATTALAPPRSSLASLTALPCAFNADGDTPLLLAARYGHVSRLTSHRTYRQRTGVRRNGRCPCRFGGGIVVGMGFMDLSCDCVAVQVDIARALLKKGVPAIDENKQGRTALHEAAVGGHSGVRTLRDSHRPPRQTTPDCTSGELHRAGLATV